MLVELNNVALTAEDELKVALHSAGDGCAERDRAGEIDAGRDAMICDAGDNRV